MTTNAIRGDTCYIEVYTGGAWAKIPEQTDSTFTPTGASIDATSKDSSGNKEKIYGYNDWECSCSAVFYPSETVFLAIEQAHLNQNTMQVRFYDGTYYRTGTALVMPGALVTPGEDKATYDVTFTGTGAYAVS